ncbi:metal-dependent hydrolase [Rubritalea tangerina]|uniref:metal-dependent hydrolase n=1 Tax=Rubritalea tangerina TaxID=430798 RepID=UPI003610CC7B
MGFSDFGEEVGHRTLTHSLLGFALFALALSPTLIFSDSLLPWALMGIASHVLLDTFNIQGVPFSIRFLALSSWLFITELGVSPTVHLLR